MIWFVLGLILGIFIGIFIMCILQISRQEEAITVPTDKTTQIVQDLIESMDKEE